MTRKIISLMICLFVGLSFARADEGMWLLKLMEQQHLADSLKKAGLQMPTSELYSESSPSLRECIGIFGGGCTGEVVSPNGLVFTNHHCGFSYIHSMSTMKANFLKDGYFAKSLADELHTPNLSFTFVVRISNVTKEVEAEARKEKADEYKAQSQAFLEPLAEKLLKKSDLKKHKGMRARIVPYFGGNEFYMFYEQTYTDVRLVATPPSNIGQFGGNTDNWMWPRQNADFSVFRIYADKNGQPADYNKKNIPLKCAKYLPISLKGYDKSDYTMIMGFPGRTSRFLTASQVELRTKSMNAPVALAGNAELEFIKNQMDSSDSLRLQLEGDYASLGNVVKNYGGMNESVEKTRLIEWKKKEEAAFRKFATQSGKPEYANIIERIDSLCKAAADTVHDSYLMRVTLERQSLNIDPSAIKAMQKALENGKTKEIEKAKAALKEAYEAGAGHYDLGIDLKKMQILVPYYIKYHRLSNVPAFLKNQAKANEYYKNLYANSIFASRKAFEDFLANPSLEKLNNDPLCKHNADLEKYFKSVVRPGLVHEAGKLAELQKIYVRGLCEMYNWSKAPDANFTLRMTYGHVSPYSPRDAVYYDWKTTLKGMFEKESKTQSDYFVNEKLRKLYEAKDYGRYAREDGELQTCFTTNNDITGGNSGSPVMNAKGELIGLAFDGNIESLSSDLKFNPQLQRCINLDVRYVLFILDKFGNSQYLFKEMDIRE